MNWETPMIKEINIEEEKTHHQIKAIVNVFKSKIPKEYRRYVHLGVTSSDIMDTANAMMIRNVMKKEVMPLIDDFAIILDNFRQEYSSFIQIGRTHGQHAIPIQFSHWITSYISRFHKSQLNIEKLVGELGGKISGAVGNYAGLSLIMEEPREFEHKVLEDCGIPKAESYSQIVEPEYLLRLLLEMNVFFGIMANMADDVRNLQRSEIAEVNETFGKNQVGSSTMPHKRNPWNAEHVKSMWKAFSPRVMTFYMDQISDHQRDLTGSASGRFIPEYIAGFHNALFRMTTVIDGLSVDGAKMLDRVDKTLWISEAIYILLSDIGEERAYEISRDISARSGNNIGFITIFVREYNVLYEKIKDRIPSAREYAGFEEE